MATNQAGFDAIVVGGGHNGLTTAGYLQRAGHRTLVLEARGMVGGACVTEEVFPGYQVSTTSYVCSLLRPKIIRDLELEKFGLHFIERNPSSFTPFPDGRSLMFWSDQKKTCEEIAKFSKKDAEAYPKYEHLLSELAGFVEPILMMNPPNPLSNRLGDLWSMAKLGLKARGMGFNVYEKLRILSSSTTDFLDRWFESDQLKSTLATDGIIGAFASPSTPGTAYVLLHHVMGETFGRKGVWAYVRGGMGGITQAMAKSFQAQGGTVRTHARVAKILVRDGKAYGVALTNGEEILANRVISNADPKRTFMDMVGADHLESDFVDGIKQIRFRSATFKLNLALSGVPNFTALPNVNGQPGPQHNGTMHISPTMEFIEKAYRDALDGKPSEKPILECTMASVLDPTLCPPGKHLMSIFVQYAPYELKNGTWDQKTKEDFANRCINLLDEYAPGFKGMVEQKHMLSPVDLENEYGLTGGNIFHGDMSLDQLFFMRPLPGSANYKTPIRGLYMCGSGTHPGGGVMGAPGHNAAQTILRERRI
jgi:phytoene dehydrogenase-like protein